MPASVLLVGLVAGCAVPSARAPNVAEQGAQLDGVHARLGVGSRAPELWLGSARMSPDGSGSGAPAEARVEGPTPLVVTGDRSAWSLAERRVVFEGNVRATRGEVVLRADRMELWWVGDRVDRVVASSAVEVRRGERVATAGTAELVVATGRIDLRDGPVLQEAGNRLVGEHMALFLDDDRLECARCRLEIAGAALRRDP